MTRQGPQGLILAMLQQAGARGAALVCTVGGVLPGVATGRGMVNVLGWRQPPHSTRCSFVLLPIKLNQGH